MRISHQGFLRYFGSFRLELTWFLNNFESNLMISSSGMIDKFSDLQKTGYTNSQQHTSKHYPEEPNGNRYGKRKEYIPGIRSRDMKK